MKNTEKLGIDACSHVFKALPAAVFFADAEAIIQVWNDAAVHLSGVDAEEVVGKTLTRAGLNPEVCEFNPDACHGCILHAYLQNLKRNAADINESVFCLHISGGAAEVDFYCRPVYSAAGELQGIAGIASDPEKLEYPQPCARAGTRHSHSNREENACSILSPAAFYDALNRDWHRYQRYQSIFSILSLEIDYYAFFESVLGENAATEIVHNAITRIGESLRRSDIIGQVGKNRFIILLANSDRKSALKVANMLLENLHQQECGDLPFVMSASIGAVSVEDKQSLDKTLERADKALQRSVELGRNQVTFWG
jgi:diguanylate cyclase (GGDEF)-like protein